MTIYEDSRTVSRADLAAWLRQLANQLESGGQIFYGAGGMVAVADQVHCELEIERESDTEISVEIEFSWATEPAPGDDGTAVEGEEAADETETDVAEAAGESAPEADATTTGDAETDNSERADA